MEYYRRLSGNVLKWIGIVSMFIDHMGAVLVRRMLPMLSQPYGMVLYQTCRYIGRIAFPIFCFTLVEGFLHTKSWKKYFLRMGIFALISEVPFDLAIKGGCFHPEVTNVMATFAVGILMLEILKRILKPDEKGVFGEISMRKYILCVLNVGFWMCVAEFAHMDYGAVGILVIAFFYLLKDNRIAASVFGCCSLLLLGKMEVTAIAAMLPIQCYSGKRGAQSKYFFYLFYPIHFLVLGIIALFI